MLTDDAISGSAGQYGSDFVFRAPLDQILDAADVKEDVLIIKMDIEGGECDALPGFLRVLDTGYTVLALLIEVRWMERWYHDELFYHMVDMRGWEVHTLHSGDESLYSAQIPKAFRAVLTRTALLGNAHDGFQSDGTTARSCGEDGNSGKRTSAKCAILIKMRRGSSSGGADCVRSDHTGVCLYHGWNRNEYDRQELRDFPERPLSETQRLLSCSAGMPEETLWVR